MVYGFAEAFPYRLEILLLQQGIELAKYLDRRLVLLGFYEYEVSAQLSNGFYSTYIRLDTT
jgi:hypothetical protein